jgi:hypothetical protein
MIIIIRGITCIYYTIFRVFEVALKEGFHFKGIKQISMWKHIIQENVWI